MKYVALSHRFTMLMGFAALSSTVLLFAQPAHAATITVTSILDSGPGTLRQTVLNASDGDTVVFDPSVFSSYRTITLEGGGQIEISKSLTIDGTANGATDYTTYPVIAGSNQSELANQRLLQIDSGITVTIRGLIFANASCHCNGATISNSGTLTIIRGDIAFNFAHSQPGFTPTYGGGIYNAGKLSLISTTLTANAATYGGAIFNDYGALLYISGNYINENGAIEGAGIMNYGIASINRTMFWREYATSIANRSVLTVTNSTFFSNTSGETGLAAGILNGNAEDIGIANVINSTFMDNRAVEGGAIYNTGLLNIINSAFTRNGSSVRGGGIMNGYSGTLSIINSTIFDNWSDIGGGIFNSSTVTLVNTIISDSPSGQNCVGDNQTFTDGGHNLEDTDTCGLQNSSSLTNTEPLLEPVGYLFNWIGYHVPVPSLLPGSPAIDAGDDTVCPATDERGISRPIGSHCDIGAYEAFNRFWWMPVIQR